MATFVSLVTWTEQGVRTYRDTVKRADAATDLARKMGGQVKDIYWTLGQYDVVVLAEFPDDESYTAWALAISSLGNVRTQSMRAYSRDEVGAIVAKAGS